MCEKGGKKPFLVCIEGNIGSGKSTMIDYFNDYEGVTLCPEPIDQWWGRFSS